MVATDSFFMRIPSAKWWNPEQKRKKSVCQAPRLVHIRAGPDPFRAPLDFPSRREYPPPFGRGTRPAKEPCPVRVMLFVPCLVQDVLPEIAEACVRVLHAAGAAPEIPSGQTCCGQLLFKLGHVRKVIPLVRRVMDLFARADAVVCPSGSCTRMIRNYPDLFPNDPGLAAAARSLAART
jgi:Fe-S oxidoreductase